MFGELGDLDICGLNQGGEFNDPSEETNYSFDAQSDETASISDDYQDTFDSENNKEQEPHQTTSEQEAFQPTDEQSEQIIEKEPQSSEPPKKSGGMIFIVTLGLLLLTAAGLFYYKQNIEQTSENGDVQAMGDYFYDQVAETSEQETTSANSESEATAQPQPSEAMATVDVDLAIQQTTVNNPESTIKKTEAPKIEAKKPAVANESQKDKKQTVASVVIPVSSGGRPDPFCPFNETVKTNVQKPAFDIIAPPRELPEEDPLIDKLMEIKITGIMYDNVRPSALITIGGIEQLVHKGDVVTEYKVVDITRNKVVLKYKTNVFEVSAGQTMQFDGVNLNPVSSLSKQFGGAYTNTPKNVLQFN